LAKKLGDLFYHELDPALGAFRHLADDVGPALRAVELEQFVRIPALPRIAAIGQQTTCCWGY
jgi:hypothetical protein